VRDGGPLRVVEAREKGVEVVAELGHGQDLNGSDGSGW
jgi:hypothetical protein